MKTSNLHLSRIKFFGLVTILLIIAVFMTMGARAQAVDWHTANQGTVAWDAVTSKDDGQPIGATDTIEYTLYTANATAADKTNPQTKWRGSQTATIITFMEEGSYWIGVKSHRMLADGTEVGESIIAWSDEPLYTNDKPFGWTYYLPPAAVKGMKRPENQ